LRISFLVCASLRVPVHAGKIITGCQHTGKKILAMHSQWSRSTIFGLAQALLQLSSITLVVGCA